MVRASIRRKLLNQPRLKPKLANAINMVQQAQASVMPRRRKNAINRVRRSRIRSGIGGNTVSSIQSNRPPITTVGRFLRGAGAMAGGYFGNASIGRSMGAGISRIFGQGDYAVTQNSLVKGGPPSFADISSGMRVCHREYVQDVISSTAFQNITFDINPSNGTLFPWLQKLAQNFEQYSIKGMVFYYNTTSGDALSSTNNALGVVGMATVTDPTDGPLASKRECEDYAGTVSKVPSCSFIAPVECKPTSQTVNRLYMYQGGVVTNEDKKFYSHGTLNLFTQGMQQAGVTVGELWVSYDIEFYTPKILPNGTTNQVGSRIYVTGVTTGQNFPLGNVAIPASSFTGNLGIYYQIDGSYGNIYFPQGTAMGYYLINITSSSGTPSTFAYAAANMTSNLTYTSTYQGGSKSETPTPNASVSSAWHGDSIILYKSDLNVARFSIITSVGGAPTDQSSDFSVVKFPNVAVTGVSGGFSTIHDPMFVKQRENLEFLKFVDKLKSEFPVFKELMLNPTVSNAILGPQIVEEASESCDCSDGCDCSHCSGNILK